MQIHGYGFLEHWGNQWLRSIRRFTVELKMKEYKKEKWK